MTVKSFTPSRMGIITSRRSWSRPAVVGVNFAGISESEETGFWGSAGAAEARSSRSWAAIMWPPIYRWPVGARSG